MTIRLNDHFEPRVVKGANLTLYVGGLVLVHPTDTHWEGAFIPREDHKLKFRAEVYSRGEETPREVFESSVEANAIDIRVTPVETSRRPVSHRTHDGRVSRHIEMIADFASRRLHGKDVPLRKDDDEVQVFRIKGGRAYTGRVAYGTNEKPDYYRFKENERPTLLGHWLAIDNICLAQTEVSVMLGPDRTWSHKVSEDISVRMSLDNVCNRDENPKLTCATENDFPYYYRSQGGIIDLAKDDEVTLEYCGDTPDCSNLRAPKNYRVACNVMMASDLDGVPTGIYDYYVS